MKWTALALAAALLLQGGPVSSGHAGQPGALPGPGPVAEVPSDYRLVEGIAWDAARQRLFAGTVVEGRLAFFEMGRWREIVLGSPHGGLFGMAIDAPERLLWIATGMAEPSAVPGTQMAGLIALDLDALQVVRRAPLPPGETGFAGDLAIAPDGSVLVTNPLNGAVYRCAPGCAVLETLVPAGALRSAQGIVVWRDGGHAIVADYAAGLLSVDLGTGKAEALGIEGSAMLKGIDGLVAVPGEDALIAIQNGTMPRRILRIGLDAAGRSVRSVTPLHIVPDDAGEPTLGLIQRGDLWFVADGQWERYAPGGALNDGLPPRPTPIRSLPVRRD